MTEKAAQWLELRLLDGREDISRKLWGPRLYNHSFLCSVSLPHRKPLTRVYEKTSGSVSLQLTAGSLPTASGGFVDVGLPYGPRARLVMLQLCSMAIVQQSPTIDIEDSFTSFCKNLNLPTNGQSLKSLKEQMYRLSVVSMRLSKRGTDYVETFQSPIFSHLAAEFPEDPAQRTLFPSYVKFSHEFFMSLKDHAVPLRKDAITALTHTSRGLDIYMWLSARLCRVHKPTMIKWTTLRWQFGKSTQNMSSFKERFKKALKQVLILYPEAKVDIVYGGIMIHNSPPPVKRRLSRKAGLLI